MNYFLLYYKLFINQILLKSSYTVKDNIKEVQNMTSKTLIEQIKYYLSDQNVQNDQFFYNQVASNKDHYIKVEVFLGCRKIKKLGVNKIQELLQAITKDHELQLSQDNLCVRRKNLDNLPQFKPKKKTKTDQLQKTEHTFRQIQPVIFTLSTQKQQSVPFKYIQQGLLKNLNVFTSYVRFNKTQGHFAMDKKSAHAQLVQKIQKQGFKIGDAHLRIKKTQGDDLSQFWQKHGGHYNLTMQNLKQTFQKKTKQQKKHIKKLKKPQQFIFNKQPHYDTSKIKHLFKQILLNPINTPLNQTQQSIIKQLFSYHQKYDQKMKQFKFFVVDSHKDYPNTKCLFIVRQDDTREDFSIVKCINKIQEKYQL